MIYSNLNKKIEKVEALSKSSKWKRLINNPFKYLLAIGLKNGVYPFWHKPFLVRCKLFTGQSIRILLPASTDIFLTGGKSHITEIKLAKFLMQNLNQESVFWDIGAHYGYFSMLGSQLVSDKGKVVSVEASPATFKILRKNSTFLENIEIINSAVGEDNGMTSFFEFPNLFSEFNSMDMSQYQDEKWFSKNRPQEVSVNTITLDELLDKQINAPDIIKIDVEGGEYAVISGAASLLSQDNAPVIVMEYLTHSRHNIPHRKAAQQLAKFGYKSFLIQDNGEVVETDNIENHLLENNLESDNVVFKKIIKASPY